MMMNRSGVDGEGADASPGRTGPGSKAYTGYRARGAMILIEEVRKAPAWAEPRA